MGRLALTLLFVSGCYDGSPAVDGYQVTGSTTATYEEGLSCETIPSTLGFRVSLDGEMLTRPDLDCTIVATPSLWQLTCTGPYCASDSCVNESFGTENYTTNKFSETGPWRGVGSWRIWRDPTPFGDDGVSCSRTFKVNVEQARW